MEISPDFATAKKEFLDLLISKGAIKIAKRPEDFFTLKSGRKSPVFVNIGALSDGQSQAVLKRAYATAAAHGLRAGVLSDFSFVFGPAYKGIPLASLTTEGLFELYGKNTGFLYDRKEAKDYGDTEADQLIVGAGAWKPGSSVLLVDDVIATGKAKYQALDKLKVLSGFKLSGMVVAVDRQELMGDATVVADKSALKAFEDELGVRAVAVLTMQDIFARAAGGLDKQARQAWAEYFVKYGAVRLSQ